MGTENSRQGCSGGGAEVAARRHGFQAAGGDRGGQATGAEPVQRAGDSGGLDRLPRSNRKKLIVKLRPGGMLC